MLLGLLAGLLFCPSLAHATSVIPVSERDLIERAAVIVTGQVVRVQGRRDATTQQIRTRITVAVQDVLKGELGETEISFDQRGGRVGTARAWVHGSADFAIDETVLLFLARRADGVLRVAHLYQGKFTVLADAETGIEYAVRVRPEDVSLLAPPGSARFPTAEQVELFDLVEMKARIRSAIAARRARAGASPGAAPSGATAEDPCGVGCEADGRFTLPTPAVRWFEPDAGVPVRVAVHGAGEPAIPGAGLGEVRAAADAWSNVPGSSFKYVMGGRTAAVAPDATDKVVVLFGDPLGEIDAPVGCTGALAVTITTWSDRESRVVRGVEFRRLLGAQVIFNDGWDGCGLLGDSAWVAAVATHELGHALGLGHSSAPDSIMYAQSHRGGQGATLGAADIAALRYVYPEGLRAGSGGLGPASGGAGVVSAPMAATAGDPSLTVSVASAAPGAVVTVSLGDWDGAATDWLALAPVGSPMTTYGAWVYVSTLPGSNPRTWNLTLPSVPGGYEVRLLRANGFVLWVASPAVNVVTTKPRPAITGLSPGSVMAGASAFTVTVSGSGFTSGTTVHVDGALRATTFVSASELRAAIGAGDVASVGDRTITAINPTPCGDPGGAGGFVGPPLLTLYWINNADAGTSFVIERKVLPGGSYAVLATTAAGATTYEDAAVSEAVSYCYRVRATSADGQSGYSAEACGVPLSGGVSACTSAGATLSVGAPPGPPVLTSVVPSSIPSGGDAIELEVNGSAFELTSAVRIDGVSRPTTYVSDTRLRVTLAAADRASPGSREVTVFTPPPGGGSSAPATVTVVGPSLALSATLGPPGSLLTVTLSDWSGSGGDWLGVAPVGAGDTTYGQWVYVTTLPGGSSRTWNVAFPAALGSYEVRLFRNGFTRAATSPSFTVALINLTPAIATLVPSSVAAGSGSFDLEVTGSGFASGAVGRVDGAVRPTSVLSTSRLVVTVAAGDVASIGSRSLTVLNPTPCVADACASASAALAITAPPPAPVLAGISPTSISADGASPITLTANGSSFVPSSQVQVNGAARPTTFVSATQLTAVLPPADFAFAGSLSITVVTPAPGGGTSAARSLTVVGPALALSAALIPPGGALTATLTDWGGGTADWVALAPVTAVNTSYIAFAYVSGLPGGATRTWTISAPPGIGAYEVRLFKNNGYVRLATSPAVTVALINLTPAITSLSPPSVVAGSAPSTLVVHGSGFGAGAIVQVDGAPRATVVVSASRLEASLLAGDVAAVGTRTVTVLNPVPCVAGLCGSAGAPLAVTAPPPAPGLTGIAPTTAAAGGGPLALTATGSSFTPASVVQVNGSPRATAFVSSTQLTATVTAADLAIAGTLGLTVMTPAPGGGTSAAVGLSVIGPALSVSPSTGPPGSPVVVTLSSWSGAPTDWVTIAPVGAADTTYLTFAYVPSLSGGDPRTWTLALPAALGTYEVRLFRNNGFVRGATSAPFTVANVSPTPTLTSLSPPSAVAGTAGLTLTVDGAGLAPGAVVQVNGAARSTTFVSSTRVTASIPAADLAAVGSRAISVTNPSPCVGGPCASGALTLAVTPPPPAPVVSGLTPASRPFGSAAFTLAVDGSGFTPQSVVRVNGALRTTTFVSATGLLAAITAADVGDLAVPSLAITVETPAPGGGTSPPRGLPVTQPTVVTPPTVAPGASMVISVEGWLSATLDWIALAPDGAAATTYGSWAYLKNLPSPAEGTRTWTLTAPTVPGPYRARVLLNNGFMILSTSPIIVVGP